MARNVGPVQVAMAGLYGMLGVKDGSNPDVITGFVQPTLDAGPWWLRATQEQLAPGNHLLSTGAVDFQRLALVPVNEWWHIEMLFARLNLDAATASNIHNLSLMVRDATLQDYYRTAPLPIVVNAAGDLHYQMGAGVLQLEACIRDLWIMPGSELGIMWCGDAGGPDAVDVSPVWGTRARV